MLHDNKLSDVLFIDLTKKKFWIENKNKYFEKYIGGAGVGIQLLNDECPPNCEPFSPENPIIFTIGALTGYYPLASKTVAMFKSPLTGNLGESHCGGRSAISMQMAGYGSIVIKGKSDIPVYLSIENGKVHFRDATTLWGMRNSFTVGRIIRENESGNGLRSIMRIGRAGEKLVSYACVTTETYRHFGRLGLGAVFGSKNLKGIMISGKRSMPIVDRKKFRQLYDGIYNTAVSSPTMKKYHDLGTAQNILPLNEIGALPTRNLKQSSFEKADKISGEYFAEKYLGRRLACAHCPVGCIHIAALREPYEDEPYFYKTSMISYDYELIYSVGSMLGISNPEYILKLMDQIEMLGLDAMSAGVVLAWATEALEKGIISEKETNGIKLAWGELPPYIEAVQAIINQPNEFYKALAKGVDFASGQYGGRDFALSFGKNEMPGYHTGPGAHIGFLTGTRHSHLDNAGYSIDQKEMMLGKLAPKEFADKIVAEEEWRQILSSLVICFFARGIYTPEIVSQTLETVGLNYSKNDLNRIGNEIYLAKNAFKYREGFNFDSLKIPKRIFETPSPVGEFDEKYVREVIQYIKVKAS